LRSLKKTINNQQPTVRIAGPIQWTRGDPGGKRREWGQVGGSHRALWDGLDTDEYSPSVAANACACDWCR
jgi:hypothetical protein